MNILLFIQKLFLEMVLLSLVSVKETEEVGPVRLSCFFLFFQTYMGQESSYVLKWTVNKVLLAFFNVILYTECTWLQSSHVQYKLQCAIEAVISLKLMVLEMSFVIQTLLSLKICCMKLLLAKQWAAPEQCAFRK